MRGSWESIPWLDAPYFSLEINAQPTTPNTTYVSVAGQSLSLAAPLFPASSRWVNLSLFNGSDVSRDASVYEPVRKILQHSHSIKLFHRSAPKEIIPGTNQPTQKAIDAINAYLQPHLLAIKVPTDCRLFPSKSMAFLTFLETSANTEERRIIKEKAGIWVCSLDYPVAPPPELHLTSEQTLAKKIFERMESLCPRFFAPGQRLVSGHPAGHSRTYTSSDSYLIVTREGDLYIKYERALNPQRVGSGSEILKPEYTIDCNKFRGRSGLPWEREI